ncbi:unnamed protein product, partial [Aphanomyces euteiches]
RYIEGGMVEMDGIHGFKYVWKVKQIVEPNQPVLHFAMEHHKSILTFASQIVHLSLHSHTRGLMQAYTIDGSNYEWQFCFPDEEETKLAQCAQFDAPRDPSPDDLTTFCVREILHDEIYGGWEMPLSYYFKGKALQKHATMCLLAAKLASIDKTPAAAELASNALKKLKQLLDVVGANTSTFPLVYDEVYKGIVSSEGFAKHDINVEFGNAVYNDHHYHYGYFITAVAIAYHLDPSYIQTNPTLFHWTSTLIRDVLNASLDDISFPRFRHFDWFYGHSYSHGVTCMVDGKDEESTSEEINCLYGVNLWAQVTQNAALLELSHVMLKLAALSHRTYFLLSSSNVSHPPDFIPNKVSGILFDNKSDYATWFSPNRECIHGIQMLPVSPILEYSRPISFIREEWDAILSKLKLEPTNAWVSLLQCNYSSLSPKEACQQLENCAMDDGLSRAYALYYAMTRPI